MPKTMHENIGEVLIPADRLQQGIKELGEKVTKHYNGQEIIMLCVLKGAAVFLADLCKHIDTFAKIEFLAVSSYGASTKSSGTVKITKDLDNNIEGQHVLIVEDIVDTGLTLRYLIEYLKSHKPASIKVCSLLSKPSRREVEVPVDFMGFEVPDKFVVGYGLDYAENYRNLPYIGVLKPEVYSR